MISKKAKYIESTLKHINLRKIVSKMMLNPKRNTRYRVPSKKISRKYITEHFAIDNRDCFYIKSSPNPTINIIYLHGGGYTMEAQKNHWDSMDYILDKVDCMLTYVDYPLAPEHTCVDTINMVKKVYAHIASNNQEIVIMGDSAGGGLAFVLAQAINAEDTYSKPSKVILLSPWLDISMIDDIPEELSASDLVLDKETLVLAGEKYVGDLSTNDPLCSPLYGDVSGIDNLIIFTGTSEILNLQAKLLKEKVENNNEEITYHEYENMQHVWMGYPIPEAYDALDKICELIK